MKATAPCFSHRCLIPSLWSARLREVKCTTHVHDFACACLVSLSPSKHTRGKFTCFGVLTELEAQDVLLRPHRHPGHNDVVSS